MTEAPPRAADPDLLRDRPATVSLPAGDLSRLQAAIHGNHPLEAIPYSFGHTAALVARYRVTGVETEAPYRVVRGAVVDVPCRGGRDAAAAPCPEGHGPGKTPGHRQTAN